MSPRRTCAALAVIVAMLALVGAPGIIDSARDQRDQVAAAEPGSIVHAVRVDGTAPRLTGAQVFDRVGAERTLRAGFVLFAVLAALLWAAAGGRRDVARRPNARRAARSYRFPIAGRAPPSYRLSIA
jgi:hypothetical protein